MLVDITRLFFNRITSVCVPQASAAEALCVKIVNCKHALQDATPLTVLSFAHAERTVSRHALKVLWVGQSVFWTASADQRKT